MVAGDLLDGEKCRVDGAVADGDAVEELAVLSEGQMGGGRDGVAGGDHIPFQHIGRGDLHGGGGHDGVQLPGGDLLLFGGDGLECLVDLVQVLLAQVVAQVQHRLGHGGGVIVGGQEQTAVVILDTVVEGGAFLAAGLAHPGDLAGDALHLGGLKTTVGVVDVALGLQDLGHIGQGDQIQPVGGGLDLPGTVADGGEGAGIGHGQVIGAGDAETNRGKLGDVGVQVPEEGGELVGEHGTGGVADGDGLHACGNGGGEDLIEEGPVAPGGVVGHEFHVGAEGQAVGDGLPDGLDHGRRLLVVQVLHLNGADGGADLQSRMPGVLQCVPGGLDALGVQGDGDRNGAALDGGGHGFDPQGVDLGLDDGFQLDEVHPQLIQQLRHLDLLPEGKVRCLGELLHGHIADSDLVHNGCSFFKKMVFIMVGSRKKKKPRSCFAPGTNR